MSGFRIDDPGQIKGLEKRRFSDQGRSWERDITNEAGLSFSWDPNVSSRQGAENSVHTVRNGEVTPANWWRGQVKRFMLSG